MRRLEAVHANHLTIHANFRQVRLDEAFQEEIRSDGELWYHKPDRFRADYRGPQPTITLINHDTFYMLTEELNQVEYWKFETPEERHQQLHTLLIAFGFDVDDLLRRYEIHSSADEPAPRQELIDQNLDPERYALFIV